MIFVCSVMTKPQGVMWGPLLAGFSFSRNLWGFCVFFNAKTTIRLYGVQLFG